MSPRSPRPDAVALPPDVRRLLDGRALEPVRLGESAAAVWRCTQPDSARWYLKAAPLGSQLGLEREADCMRWMREAGLPVPAVLMYQRQGDIEFLLSDAAVGVPASDSSWRHEADRVATALGRGLARLHSIDVRACPFDRRIAVQLAEARAHVAAGDVDEDDFDAPRLGQTAAHVFAGLLRNVPAEEDLVFVHGDFCLPNVLLAPAGADLDVTGLVDCGRAGVGDRHQDLALAMRSLRSNFDADALGPFLEAYGNRDVDARRLEFFAVLDEFF